MIENTEMVALNGQSIESGKCRTHKTKNKNQTKTKKPTQFELETTIRKQTQITLIRHESSYKQLEVKTNLLCIYLSFMCSELTVNFETEKLQHLCHKSVYIF
jgi:hypothetical protein